MLAYLHIGGDRFLELFPNGPEPVAGRVQRFEGDVAAFRAAGITIDREIKRVSITTSRPGSPAQTEMRSH